MMIHQIFINHILITLHRLLLLWVIEEGYDYEIHGQWVSLLTAAVMKLADRDDFLIQQTKSTVQTAHVIQISVQWFMH